MSVGEENIKSIVETISKQVLQVLIDSHNSQVPSQLHCCERATMVTAMHALVKAIVWQLAVGLE